MKMDEKKRVLIAGIVHALVVYTVISLVYRTTTLPKDDSADEIIEHGVLTNNYWETGIVTFVTFAALFWAFFSGYHGLDSENDDFENSKYFSIGISIASLAVLVIGLYGLYYEVEPGDAKGSLQLNETVPVIFISTGVTMMVTTFMTIMFIFNYTRLLRQKGSLHSL
jgi:hypothetical protein